MVNASAAMSKKIKQSYRKPISSSEIKFLIFIKFLLIMGVSYFGETLMCGTVW